MIARSFDEAFSQVQVLVNDFRQNEAHFLSTQYSEPRVREDFINKFWMALGWDVTHSEQKNPYEQEVTVEKNVNVEGRGKRADYAFTVAPNFRDVSFFVEAKKPSRNIDNADDYFQTVRYGWNARTSVAVLTDFEQFRVLDCRYEPDIDSVLSYGALEKFHYTDYTDPEKFRRIYHLFSRADVAGGSLERYAEGLPKPSARGQRALIITGRFKSVDESFLQKLDEYRERLAQTFKRNNPQLESLELTEVTQRTLDRLVFMRFLEDKLIETSELVQKFVDSPRPWREFVATSRKLNATYNGIIFKEHSLLDGADFEVDERAFVDICASLSYARSPYNFNYIPVHILGSIYERFLGKTIVVEGAEASVQDKPEVRKADGVYYTPEYIVRYIVENTVGQLIDKKKPEEISAMRFADISCGSGSFLIGVYDVLLRYHRTYYNANKRRRDEGLRAGCIKLPDGTLQLSLKQKRDILRDNIYGVDVDAQAVEVAQLSLYLKLLEDETTASARLYQIELGDKLLPSLSNNVAEGNSLVDWDIQGELFDKSEEKKINPMSFKDAFPKIVRSGGFDAIVGNPPYGMVEDLRLKDYFEKHFNATEGRFDTYELFIERAIALCHEGGSLGYIIPSPFLSNLYARKLRHLLLTNTAIEEITNFGMDVFADPTVHTCILILRNEKVGAHNIKIRKQVNSIEELGEDYDYTLPQSSLGGNANFTFDIFIDPVNAKLLGKLQACGQLLGEVCYIRQCIKTGDDTKYVQASISRPGAEWKKTLRGRSINRYITVEKDIWLKYGSWLARNWKNKSFYETPKIAIRETGNRIIANLDLENRYFLSSLYAVYPKASDSKTHLSYLLGIINSRLATYFVKIIALELTKGAFTKFRTNQLARLPIRAIDFSHPADKSCYHKMVQLVEQMLDTKQQLAEAVTDSDRNLYERKCANLDRQIDELVYELYGLTEEEIELVEAS